MPPHYSLGSEAPSCRLGTSLARREGDVTDLDLGHVPVSRARLLPIYSRIANKVQPYSCAFWPIGAVVKSIHTAAAARGPCRHNLQRYFLSREFSKETFSLKRYILSRASTR